MIAARPRRDRVLAPPSPRVFGSTVSVTIRECTTRRSASRLQAGEVCKKP
jgi:hypothetical protein